MQNIQGIINPSWDMFIIIIAVIIMAYSFIIGHSTTIKLIISTYISLLASDGIINIAHKYLFSTTKLIDGLPTLAINSKELISAKAGIFLVCLVLLSVKGGFEAAECKQHKLIDSLYLLIFSILSATLIVSGFLVFLSGGSFIYAFITHPIIPSEASTYVYNASIVAKFVIDYAPLTFSLPAIVMIIRSFGNND